MASSGPVSENFDHMDVEGAKAKAAAPPPVSAFTPLVGVLSAVCLGLLIAVIAMAATIAASDGNGSSSHTTVVCPTGAPAVSAGAVNVWMHPSHATVGSALRLLAERISDAGGRSVRGTIVVPVDNPD